MEEAIDIGHAVITRLSDDIYKTVLKKGSEIGEEEGYKILRTIVDDNGGKRFKSLVIVERGCTIDPGAKEYVGSNERLAYVKADSMVVKNFAHSLIVNFYLKYHKPDIPTQAFKSEEEAFDWLKDVKI
ncbi:MAG: hypothetical protein HRT74_07090 [Flavobacteriales bacterium]|nr:hypothetical protein [Flavobacteriales bacterium]